MSPASLAAPTRDPSPYELARELLVTDTEAIGDLVDVLRATVDVPLAALTVLDRDQFHFLVCSGAVPFVTDRDETVCRWSMGHDEVVSIPDLSADARTSGLPYVDGRLGSLRSYASAPVRTPDGTMVGRLCVFDDSPRELSRAHTSLLRVLADSVSAHLDLRMRLRATVGTGTHVLEDPETASRIEHDLRSPLGSMRTSLDMLAEVTHAAEGTAAHRLIGVAQRSALRLTGLVEGLAQLHDVATPPIPRVVHLGDLVKRVFDDLHDELSDAGGYAYANALPVLTCDPERVELVLRELVGNAIRFRREDEPLRVTVTAHRVHGIDWRVSVTDNGIGIDPADRAGVLEVLTRLTGRPGNGLGLPTVVRAVAGQGGRIGIEDGPGGVGTTVWFELPG